MIVTAICRLLELLGVIASFRHVSKLKAVGIGLPPRFPVKVGDLIRLADWYRRHSIDKTDRQDGRLIDTERRRQADT